MTLVGLGSPTFEKAVQNVAEIYGYFDRHTEIGELESFQLTRNGEAILDVSNRLFTPRKDAPKMRAVPFADGVDRYGNLKEIVGEGEYLHGEDNVVEYFRRCADEQGTMRFIHFHKN